MDGCKSIRCRKWLFGIEEQLRRMMKRREASARNDATKDKDDYGN